jgi:hypothetical protein
MDSAINELNHMMSVGQINDQERKMKLAYNAV